jgi:hypothetical protein
VKAQLHDFHVFRDEQGRVQIAWISDQPMPTGALEIDTGDGFREVARSDETDLRNHRLFVSDLTPGQSFNARVRITPDHTSPPQSLRVPGPFVDHTPTPSEIPLRTFHAPRGEQAVLSGIPLERGRVFETDDLGVTCNGQYVHSMIDVLARHPDGSLKWIFARSHADTPDAHLALQIRQSPPSSRTLIPLGNQGTNFDNGPLTFRVRREGFALLPTILNDRGDTLTGESKGGNVRLIDDAGTTAYLGPPDRWELEENGGPRIVLHAEGPFIRESDGKPWFRYRLRQAIQSNEIRVELTLINDAMDVEFAKLRNYALRLPLAGDGPLEARMYGRPAFTVREGDVHSIEQLDHERSRYASLNRMQLSRDRLEGWAVISRADNRLALSVRDFWQTWPKGIAIKPDGIHLRLLPEPAENTYTDESAGDWFLHHYWFDQGRYVFKRGMALRTDFVVRFDAADDSVPEGDWSTWAARVHDLPYALPEPDYLCRSGAFGPILPAQSDFFPEYDTMVARHVDFVHQQREDFGAYGWMNFGDWFGERGLNWGNSEYDWGWCMAQHFARTGRWDYFRSGEEMTRHLTTIDTIHLPWADRMPGRVYAHCTGHVGGGIHPTHLTIGGKPWDEWYAANRFWFNSVIDAGGHIQLEGNFIYAMLTGDREFLRAATLAADAQAAYLTPDFQFRIERSAGWPLANMVAAYEATGNPYYLNAARIIVERILATQDPVGGGWLLPQDPSECHHPPPHYGGKSFATGVLLYGLMRYDLVEPRSDVKHAIMRACDWLTGPAWNPELKGWRYKTNCDVYANEVNGPYISALCITGLAYAWSFTGNDRYMAPVRDTMPAICDATAENPQQAIAKQASMVIRQSAYALPMLKQQGIMRPDHLEAPSP